jgi:prophage maintenance system killer protein
VARGDLPREARYPGTYRLLHLHAEARRSEGLRPAALLDLGALERALMRPRLFAQFTGADLFEQAALLGVSLVQAGTFVDGNAPTALLALRFFLERNGRPFGGDPLALTELLLAAVEATEEERDGAVHSLARLLREHSEPIG